jgi:NAD(P)H-hydrate epimerase
MREVDRAMIEDFGVDLVQMMENAGRNLAGLAVEKFLEDNPRDRKVTILTGRGGNGGGGLVCARRLHNWGAFVQVFTTAPFDQFLGVPAKQLDILHRMGVGLYEAREDTVLPKTDLVIDAIIGYSLRGAPTGVAASLIPQANTVGASVLSLDVPSGVDTTTGEVHEPAIAATATMTLALPKTGLLVESARPNVGELYLADISVPPRLYRGIGLDMGPIFAGDEVLRLT